MQLLGIPGITDEVEIGRGGFGVVYKATETDLRRSVAVKMLRGDLDQRARDRFDRERQAMGSLSGHPNIVTVYRSGYTESGQPFIVMEYLEPGSMDDVVRRQGALPWIEAAKIGVEIAGVLESAHQAEVLHRDIKPGNILLSTTGQAKLGDFGIARITGSPETTSSTITASVAHAAPEIINGQRPSHASDVYSLASTLYELVVGDPPFFSPTDETMVPMLARIARDQVPERPALSGPFYDVLSVAMAKDPDDRYESSEAFGTALMELVDSHGSGEPSGPVVFETRAFATPLVPVAEQSSDSSDDAPVTSSGQGSTASSTVENKNLRIALGVVVGIVLLLVLWVVTRGDDTITDPGPSTTNTTAQTATSSSSGLPVATSSDFDGYSTVFDRTGAIRVEAPSAWVDVDTGAPGANPSLLVSPNVLSAATSFDTPGLAISVAETPLLDPDAVLDASTEDDCAVADEGEYRDSVYTGRYRRFNNCGATNATIWVVVAAPAENDFTVVVGVQALDERDVSAARRVLDTFFVERAAL